MMALRTFRLAAFGVALVAPALSTAQAPAPAWTVDKAASRIAFTTNYSGSPVNGSFGRWDARIRFDPRALNASSVVATVDLGSARTGDETGDQMLRSPDLFFTAKFPRAIFSAKQFRALGAGRFEAIGTLSIRGVSRPARLPFQLAIAGPNARMKGELVVNRKAFGIGQGQFAGADSLPFNVRVSVAIVARRLP